MLINSSSDSNTAGTFKYVSPSFCNCSSLLNRFTFPSTLQMPSQDILSEEQLQKYRKDGYVVVPNFLTDVETSSLRSACHRIVEEMNPDEHTKTIFSTQEDEQERGEYFLESGDKVRFFFEKEALDKNGQLKVSKHLALNKIGHAIHWHVPEFRKVSFSDKVKTVAKQLGFQSPALVQSMYIFKQPGFGGEVTPHKDSTFLSTEPQSCIGLWIALEDATLENGCLWFNPGSQKISTNRRFIRNPDKKGPLTIFTAKPDPDSAENYVPAPVAKGSLIIIDGQIDHKSQKNESKKSRHVYTVHLIERKDTLWSSKNWLQPTKELQFTGLYENEPQ